MGRDWINLTSRCINNVFLLSLGMGTFEQAQFRCRKIKRINSFHTGTVAVVNFRPLTQARKMIS